MENEKLNYVIELIKEMELDNKLKVALCMCDSQYITTIYDEKEMYKYFDNLLKEVDIVYKNYTANLSEYPYVIFVASKIMELNPNEQNQVALYLFNSIEIEVKKKYKSL